MRRRNFLVQNRAATKTVEFHPLQVFCCCLSWVWSTRNGAEPKKNKLGTARYSGTGSIGCWTFQARDPWYFREEFLVFPREESLVFPHEESLVFPREKSLVFPRKWCYFQRERSLENVEALDFQIWSWKPGSNELSVWAGPTGELSSVAASNVAHRRADCTWPPRSMTGTLTAGSGWEISVWGQTCCVLFAEKKKQRK